MAGALAILTAALLASTIAVPAAFARPARPMGGGSPSAPSIVVGDMTGWQIALIAPAVAVVAAALAVILDRPGLPASPRCAPGGPALL